MTIEVSLGSNGGFEYHSKLWQLWKDGWFMASVVSSIGVWGEQSAPTNLESVQWVIVLLKALCVSACGPIKLSGTLHIVFSALIYDL